MKRTNQTINRHVPIEFESPRVRLSCACVPAETSVLLSEPLNLSFVRVVLSHGTSSVIPHVLNRHLTHHGKQLIDVAAHVFLASMLSVMMMMMLMMMMMVMMMVMMMMMMIMRDEK